MDWFSFAIGTAAGAGGIAIAQMIFSFCLYIATIERFYDENE